MKRIKLPQGTVVVDEIADIKGYYHDSFTNKIYHSGDADYVKSPQVNNIVASTFFVDKDIPMYLEQSKKYFPIEFEMETISTIPFSKESPYRDRGYVEQINTTRDKSGQLWCKLKKND